MTRSFGLCSAMCYHRRPLDKRVPRQLQGAMHQPTARYAPIVMVDRPLSESGLGWLTSDGRIDHDRFGDWAESFTQPEVVLDLEAQPFLTKGASRWETVRVMLDIAKTRASWVQWGVWVDPECAAFQGRNLLRDAHVGGGFDPGMLDLPAPDLVDAVEAADFVAQCVYAHPFDFEQRPTHDYIDFYAARVAANVTRWHMMRKRVLPVISPQFLPGENALDCNRYVGSEAMTIQLKACRACGGGIVWGGNEFNADGSVTGRMLPWSQFGAPWQYQAADMLWDAAGP